jgi:methylenetetrahydrofolate reductase (NADPH)
VTGEVLDITSHSAEVVYDETPDGIKRRTTRKRPGTLGICALIQNKLNIDAVPHVLCEGFTREESEDFLIELHYLGIDNVLAIRGDDSGRQKSLDGGRTANQFASDLIGQITAMNNGNFLEDLADAFPVDFCVGAAGYPEKHFEAPNLRSDVARLKQKVEAGAEYIVTQMFFDNRHYFHYVDLCREVGIEVPIIPGLKVLATAKQVTNIPRNFYCEVPSALANEVEADPEHALDIGVEWARRQAMDLLEAGVPSIHFYVMQSSKAVTRVIEGLGL